LDTFRTNPGNIDRILDDEDTIFILTKPMNLIKINAKMQLGKFYSLFLDNSNKFYEFS